MPVQPVAAGTPAPDAPPAPASDASRQASFATQIAAQRKAAEAAQQAGRPPPDTPTSLLADQPAPDPANCINQAASVARDGRDDLAFLRNNSPAGGGARGGAERGHQGDHRSRGAGRVGQRAQPGGVSSAGPRGGA